MTQAGVSRDEAERYRVFFEASREGMISFSPDGFACEANAAAVRLIGGDISGVGMSFEDLIDPEDVRRDRAFREFDVSGIFEGSLLVRRLDETCFTAEVTVRRGVCGETMMVFRSVGERERVSEIDGRASCVESVSEEPRFRALVHGTPDLVALVEGDGNIRYISPSVERMCGYTPGEVEGRNLFEFVYEGDHTVAMRDLLWTARNPGVVGVRGPDVRLRHRDGGWVTVEAFVSNHMDDPNIGALVFDCRDITERVRLEEELRKSEERFRALIENAHDFVVLASEENIALYASPSIEQTMGYTPEEFIGTVITGYIHPEDAESAVENVTQSLAVSGPHVLDTLRYRHRNGSYRWIEAVVNNKLDDPALRGIVCNCRDVTERVEAEAKLREAEERYRLLVEQVPVATYIERNDSDSSTVYISPRIEEMLGYAPEEWTDEPGLWLRTIHPEDHGRVLARHLRCNETGEPFDEEYRCIAKNGREVWIHDEAVMVRAEDSEPLYWQGVKVDITARKLAELEIVRLNTELRGEISGYTAELKAAIESLKKTEKFLEEREELLHTTFERAAIGIAHVAPGGRWLRLNEKLCEILGRERDELLGKSFQEITHPEDLDKDLAEVERLLSGEIQSYSLEKRYVRGDGSFVWASLTVSVVRGADGEAEYFISVVEDIGRRKQAEEILASLTPRELEILAEMSRGLTNAEIASRLRFSVNTIKANVRDIIRKLGVGDRTQAAVYAAETGVFGG